MARLTSDFPGAGVFLPPQLSLPALRAAAAGCQGCDLYKYATQTVFSEGPPDAVCVMIGEQPGNNEDLEGRPFVGPSGKLLDAALGAAGLARSDVYLTNAVKHFKFEMKGQRRIHVKPRVGEVRACRPWLEAEFAVLKPPMLVLLGATAAQVLLGPAFRVTRERGRVFSSAWAAWTLATVHPASLLRIPEEEDRRAAYQRFVADLGLVAAKIKELRAK